MKAILAKSVLGNKTLALKPILTKYAKLSVKEFEKTTETWNDVNPTFEYELEADSVHIGPVDDQDGQIWTYLEEGTDIRYAVMSEDFEPKTSVRVVGSTAGVGGLTHFDFENPRPGIVAREWSEVIGEKLEPKFVKDVQSLIKRTLRTF
jgi:hypothetical protein